MKTSKVCSKPKINNLLEPIWQVGLLVDIVDRVKQKRERKVFIELHDFDDCFEEKEDAIF